MLRVLAPLLRVHVAEVDDLHGSPGMSAHVGRHRRAVDEDRSYRCRSPQLRVDPTAAEPRRVEVAEARRARASAARPPCAARRCGRPRPRSADCEQCSARPSASSSFGLRPRQRGDRHLVPLLVQVPDDVERPDLAAALGRERHPVTDEQDSSCRKRLLQVGRPRPRHSARRGRAGTRSRD